MGVYSYTSHGTNIDANAAKGALVRGQYNMSIPCQGIFRTLIDTELLLTRQAHMYTADFRPGIFNIYSGLFDTQHTWIMCGRAGKHAEPAIRTFTFF